jgi:hypothetical protein
MVLAELVSQPQAATFALGSCLARVEAGVE